MITTVIIRPMPEGSFWVITRMGCFERDHGVMPPSQVFEELKVSQDIKVILQ